MEMGWIERQMWDSANIIKRPCRIWRICMVKFIQFCFIENFHDNLLEKAKMRTKSKSKNPRDCMCFRHLRHLFSACASKLWVFKKLRQKTDVCVTVPSLPGPECWLWPHRPALLSRPLNAEITRPKAGTFLFPLPSRDAAKIMVSEEIPFKCQRWNPGPRPWSTGWWPWGGWPSSCLMKVFSNNCAPVGKSIPWTWCLEFWWFITTKDFQACFIEFSSNTTVLKRAWKQKHDCKSSRN